MPRMGAQGTRAIDIARRAGISFTVHEYAHDARSTLHEGGRGYALEAVDALGLDAARVFKTIVVSVDGRLGARDRPCRAEVDLKATADALGGRKASIAPAAEASGRPATSWAGSRRSGTRRGRCPRPSTRSATAWPTIHVSAGRRGLEIELAPAGPRRLTAAAVLAPIARR